MTKIKKTQSPVKASAKKTTAKKAAVKKAAKKATRPKGNPKAKPDTRTEDAAQFDLNEFATLWQQKWADMLTEQGWPEQSAIPSVGQMPFMMPFMMPNMASAQTGSTQTDGAAIQQLQQRIAQLEYRIMELERSLIQHRAKKL